jgi:hypothetical protein
MQRRECRVFAMLGQKRCGVANGGNAAFTMMPDSAALAVRPLPRALAFA